jgi:hypothetical protein
MQQARLEIVGDDWDTPQVPTPPFICVYRVPGSPILDPRGTCAVALTHPDMYWFEWKIVANTPPAGWQCCGESKEIIEKV